MRSVGKLVFISLALMAQVHAFFAGEIVAPATTNLPGQLRQLNNHPTSPLRTSFQARTTNLFRRGHQSLGRDAARRSFSTHSQASMTLDGCLEPVGKFSHESHVPWEHERHGRNEDCAFFALSIIDTEILSPAILPQSGKLQRFMS